MYSHAHRVVAHCLTILHVKEMTDEQILEVVKWAIPGTKEIKTFFSKFLAAPNKALGRPTAGTHLGKDHAAKTLIRKSTRCRSMGVEGSGNHKVQHQPKSSIEHEWTRSVRQMCRTHRRSMHEL